MKATENSSNDKSVTFLSTTKFGKLLMNIFLFLRIPALFGLFLRSPLSHYMIARFIKKNGIDMSDFKGQKFVSFNDFFTRKKGIQFDEDDNHLISPSDSSLSVYTVKENSTFHIKGFDYSLNDFFGIDGDTSDYELIEKYRNGLCLVFRLGTTDYHRYIYVDSGYQTENHFIKGSLYSVQPVSCENFRIYTKNRRSWSILKTENFGDIAQIEIGAFSVGGIKNHYSDCNFIKGQEKGYFDLHGSTIVLLIEKDRVSLLPEIAGSTEEYRVKAGQLIGFKNVIQ